MPKVTKIEATKIPGSKTVINHTAKRKAAAYCRVSTDTEDQENSYQAQVEHFKKKLSEDPSLEFVNVYADEGISGLAMKKRESFKQMISDANNGMIDVIFVKSISRFSRNTVDTLTIIRQLKAKAVEVIFEKENLSSFDPRTEMMLTIFSSMAQEESRSISENITWGKREAFKRGQLSLPYKQFLGYDRGPDGRPVINEEQAVIVRLIYKLFLDGLTMTQIRDELNYRKIKTPSGRDKWCTKTVISILENEKYCGEAILQKTYTKDYLTKKCVQNNGEVPQYHVEDSHPAIIDPREWQIVQQEMKRRRELGSKYNNSSIFASRIYCGECGGIYGSKVWHSNDVRYRKTVFQCNRKYDNDSPCRTPHIDEATIKAKFMEACRSFLNSKETLIEDMDLVRITLDRREKLQNDIDITNAKLLGLKETLSHSAKNVKSANQIISYAAIEDEYNEMVTRLTRLQTELTEVEEKNIKIEAFIEALKSSTTTAWSDSLFRAICDKITITTDNKITFTFKNGTVISYEL